jgi:2-methylisocitrate lyase-like PEP mutase family enzyme
LRELGFTIAAHPLTLLSGAIGAMQHALAALAQGRPVEPALRFRELQEIVGFPEYDATLKRYED